MINIKTCTKCKEVKSLDSFYKSKAAKDGLKSRCKPCCSLEAKAHRKRYERINRALTTQKTEIKTCKNCKKEKLRNDFYLSPQNKDGLSYWCKTCVASSNLMQRYGLSKNSQTKILEKQNNVCAICLQPETAKHLGKLTSLAVDHNHKTGEVRGLLCTGCNKALGFFKDDIALLQEAIRYLQKRN